jgi:hypothetical protein
MYPDAPKIVSDPVQTPKAQAAAELKPRTLSERKAARLEMDKLNARIMSGFKSRARYQQPAP